MKQSNFILVHIWKLSISKMCSYLLRQFCNRDVKSGNESCIFTERDGEGWSGLF